MILPKEKPSRTIGRPVIPYRKVLDGIFSMSLEQMSVEDASQRI
jgi:hypothetical protein